MNKGAREVRGREEGTEQVAEGNFKGGTLRRTLVSIQYTAHKTTNNAALAPETLVLQIKKNSEWVYKLCAVMHRIVLFDRWMT